MKDRANDILVDYEGLCGELEDVLNVLDLATQEYSQQTTSSIIYTSYNALKHLINKHNATAKEYRKGTR